MAKAQKIETTHYIYEVELTEEQLKLYKEDESAFWDEMEMQWDDYYMDVDSTDTEFNVFED